MLRYLARYLFETATDNRPLQPLPDGRLRWPYRESATGRDTAIALEPLEWMRRFLQHVLPPYFARVRTFGWWHPAAKIRLNRVRALLRQKPLLTPTEQDTWQPPPEPPQPSTSAPPAVSAPPPVLTPATAPSRGVPVCPHCHQPMLRIGSWHTPAQLLGLLRGWRAARRLDSHPP